MSKTDKKAIIWIGLVFIALAFVIARLITGTWFGMGYALLVLAPFGTGIAYMIDSSIEKRKGFLHQDEIESRDAEIARLKGLKQLT